MSEEGFSALARLVMGVIALIFGFFAIIVGPILIQFSMQAVLGAVVPQIPTDPHFEGLPILLPFFFAYYRGIGVIGGIILVLIAYSLWKGESWAYPIAISCVSLPTMLSIISIIPYIAHVGGPPPTLIIVILGMVFYIILLMCKKSDLIEKLAKAIVFITLGMLGGIISVFIMHSTKELLQAGTNVENTLDITFLTNPDVAILGFSLPLNVACLIMCIIAIPLLAARNPKGWWLGLAAGVIGIVANYPTQIVRMVTTDFLMAGLLSTVLVVGLVIPPFKKRLIEKER